MLIGYPKVGWPPVIIVDGSGPVGFAICRRTYLRRPGCRRVRYADAEAGMLRVQIEGVEIAYADRDTLVRSKQTGRL